MEQNKKLIRTREQLTDLFVEQIRKKVEKCIKIWLGDGIYMDIFVKGVMRTDNPLHYYFESDPFLNIKLTDDEIKYYENRYNHLSENIKYVGDKSE